MLSKSTGKILLSPTHLITSRQYEKVCSAFTVAELGEMLPRDTKSFQDTDFREIYWVCERLLEDTMYADTEANARAEMLIHFIKNNL